MNKVIEEIDNQACQSCGWWAVCDPTGFIGYCENVKNSACDKKTWGVNGRECEFWAESPRATLSLLAAVEVE